MENNFIILAIFFFSPIYFKGFLDLKLKAISEFWFFFIFPVYSLSGLIELIFFIVYF